MRKRRTLNCERLERRELPANSFSVAFLQLEVAAAARVDARPDIAGAPADAFHPALGRSGSSDHTHGTGLSSDAVGAFFADHAQLGRLFHTGNPADESAFESVPALSWHTDESSSPQTPKGLTKDDEAEFWAFLRNYASKAIRREEQARGPLADHADIIQQIYVEWRGEVQAGDDIHGRVLVKESAERTAFRTAVRRVLDRTRYDGVRQRRRVESVDHEAPTDANARDWADLEIDLAQGVAKLSDKEKDILDLRRWGMTFEEIGAKLGLPKQRAFEAYTEVLNRLTALYRD